MVGNARLAFSDSRTQVESFVSARLRHHSAGSHEFVTDWNALDARVSELLGSLADDCKYIVIADVMNPLTDMELVSRMTDVLDRTGSWFAVCEGPVPGTEVRAVLSVANMLPDVGNQNRRFGLADLDGERTRIVRWETQSKYNNQLNLYKFKRLKLFLALSAKVGGLHEMTIAEVMAALSRDDVYALLASFGDELRQVSYASCPHCDGRLNPLFNSMSQPFCGYLPNDRSLYHECESCGLVVQSPSVHEDDVHAIYDQWDKQDFVASTNNPYTDEAVRCDFGKLFPMLPAKTRSLDLGGGIGNFSRYLFSRYPAWEITHSDFEIKSEAGSGVRSRTLDFTNNTIGNREYDLITAWEVLEHIPYHKLSFVLHNIWQALSPGGFFVFSTPNFDSPLCKSFDFYALCPPFHYLVFGERWLRRYFADSAEFEIFDVKHCSDFLDDALNWYGYGAKTCPSMAMRGTAKVLQSLFEMDGDNTIRRRLAAAGMGTEIIMALRKKA